MIPYKICQVSVKAVGHTASVPASAHINSHKAGRFSASDPLYFILRRNNAADDFHSPQMVGIRRNEAGRGDREWVQSVSS